MLQPKNPSESTLDSTNKEKLDANIKMMLDNGASQEDIISYASDFKSKFGVKKKDPQESEPIVQNQESVSEPVQEVGSLDGIEVDTVSDAPNEAVVDEDKSMLKKGFDFAKGFAIKKLAQGYDAFQHLKSASASTLAGLSGVPNFINKLSVTASIEAQKLFGVEGIDRFQEQLNALPEKEREELINTIASGTNPSAGLGQLSADAQNKLTDISEEINSKTKQYEGNIVDDITAGNLDQAAARVVNGFAGSAPSLVLAAAPGGLLAIGAGSASQKQEELDREGEDLDKNSVANAIVSGTAEGIFSGITAKLLQPLKNIVKGDKKLAGEFAESFTSNLFKSVGLEATEEAATTITQQLSDDFFKGKDLSITTKGFWKNVADAALVGGVMGGGISTATLGASKVMSDSNKETIKKSDDQISLIDSELQKDLPDDIKKQLKATKETIESNKESIIQSEYEKFKSLSPEERAKFGELDEKLETIKEQHNAIKDNPNLDEGAKEILLEQKVAEAQKLLDQKEELLTPKEEANAESKEETPKTEERQVEEGTLESTTAEEVNKPVDKSNPEVNEEVDNETTQSENTVPDGEVGLTDSPDVQQREEDTVQPTVEPEPSEGEVEVKPTVKKVKSKGFAGKESEFDVTFDSDGRITKISNPNTGKEVSKWRYDKKTKKPIGRNANYTKIEADALGVVTDNKTKEERKQKLSDALEKNKPVDNYEKAMQYFATGGLMNPENLIGETGYSLKEVEWVSKYGKINSQKDISNFKTAEQLSEKFDLENSSAARDAILEVIRDFGSREDIQDAIIDRYAEESQKLDEQELRAYVNGLNEKDFAKFESVKAEDDFISELTDKEAIEYYEDQYGKESERNDSLRETESPSVQKPSREKEAKSKQERKEIAFEKIDNFFDKLKEALPSINDADITPNGFTQDQLIDLMAKSVKHLVSTGIDIDAAIKQVVQSIKDKLNIDIDPEEVKSKVGDENKTTTPPPPKKPQEKKEPSKKSNEKSLLNRAHKGMNSAEITDAIEFHGLHYETENQQKAKEKAITFVNKVGIDNALKAVREGSIKGAEKAFVYGEIIDTLDRAIKNADPKQKYELEEKYGNLAIEIGNLVSELDTSARGAGRFISALRLLYATSNLQYDLTKQVNDYKARNNGTIPDDVLERFTEANEKLKELEDKIAEAEERLADALAQSIIDEVADSEKKKPKSKSQKQKAKELADRIRSVKIHKKGIFSSATPASLAFDSAVEVVAKSIQAGGTIADAISQGLAHIKKSSWYKSLTKRQKKDADDTYDELINEIIAKGIGGGINVTVDDDGKISIPRSTIVNFVESGITDIDQISQLILDELIENYPDLTVRDVRDAITGYGKKFNLSKDEIDVAIRKMNRWGKLLSAEEDVKAGERPKRSGVQRDKESREEAKKKREINELLREFPVDESVLEDQWKNALDTVKSRLRNQISDLITQIKNKEKSKPERNPIEYDERAKELKTTRDNLKEILEDIVGKPELTQEQKLKRAENSLINSIEKLQEDIVKGNIEFKKKADPLTSERLEELREQQAGLRESLNKLREDAGIIEKRRLELRKNAVKKRTQELKERIKNKDYVTKKKAPLKEDLELRELQAEKQKVQEIYDKEKYKEELKNRSAIRKFADAIVRLFGIPRILLATGEFSTVLIQGGIQTTALATRKPKLLARNFIEAFKAFGSNTAFQKYENLLMTMPEYESAKKNKVSLTRTDYRLDAKEEVFQGDYISSLWDMIAKGLDNATGNKEFHSIGDSVLSKIGLANLKDKKKLTAGEQLKNVNPFRALERATTVYMNNLRMWRYMDGMKMLQKDGKNEIDHEKDYRRMAKAINSLTGRADMVVGDLNMETMSPILNVIFFSFRNTLSTFNQLNPVWYSLVLRDSSGKVKPSAAQKMAIGDMMRFTGTTVAFMLLVQAAAGKDEDDEWKVQIETDPRSSDFMKMRIGNARFDPWHGMTQLVSLYSRILSGSVKKTDGSIKNVGEGYKADTAWDLITRTLITNKFSPTTAMIYRRLNTGVNKDGERVDNFGNEYSFMNELEAMYPIYYQGINEMVQEDPDTVAWFLTAIGFFGLNSQVYGNEKKKFNSIQERDTTSKDRAPRKRREQTSTGLY